MRRSRVIKGGIAVLSLSLLVLLPAGLFGEIVIVNDPGEGGGGGGGSQVTTTTRTLDWSIPDWEMSGSDPLTYEVTNGQLTRVELRDNTGAVVFSMNQSEIQAMIAQNPSLVAPPAEEQSAWVAGPARATSPHSATVCGGPFSYTESTIYQSSVVYNGDLH